MLPSFVLLHIVKRLLVNVSDDHCKWYVFLLKQIFSTLLVQVKFMKFLRVFNGSRIREIKENIVLQHVSDSLISVQLSFMILDSNSIYIKFKIKLHCPS